MRVGRGADRRGGCSGKARHNTAIAPELAAVRQATRAPIERPPTISAEPVQLVRVKRIDHGPPRGVELLRRRRRTPSRDSIRLFDQHHGHALLQAHIPGGGEVGSTDAAAGAVAEHQRGARTVGAMDVDERRSVWG